MEDMSNPFSPSFSTDFLSTGGPRERLLHGVLWKSELRSKRRLYRFSSAETRAASIRSRMCMRGLKHLLDSSVLYALFQVRRTRPKSGTPHLSSWNGHLHHKSEPPIPGPIFAFPWPSGSSRLKSAKTSERAPPRREATPPI